MGIALAGKKESAPTPCAKTFITSNRAGVFKLCGEMDKFTTPVKPMNNLRTEFFQVNMQRTVEIPCRHFGRTYLQVLDS